MFKTEVTDTTTIKLKIDLGLIVLFKVAMQKISYK